MRAPDLTCTFKPKRSTKYGAAAPIFLRSQEAVEFFHKLTPEERSLLKADSRLVIGATDYTGHFWSTSLPTPGYGTSTGETLQLLRSPCTT
jgi:hypothetical protein